MNVRAQRVFVPTLREVERGLALPIPGTRHPSCGLSSPPAHSFSPWSWPSLFNSGSKERRKVYSLTGTGERHLSGETNRVQEIVSRLMHFLRHPGEGTGTGWEPHTRLAGA